MAEPKMDEHQLKKDWSWYWRPQEDARNRDLALALKTTVRMLMLMFVSGNIFIGVLSVVIPSNFNENPLVGIGVPLLGFWVVAIFVLSRVNKTSWSASIDADKRLRQALGEKYDAALEKQLETKSLRNLVDENWFISEYSRHLGSS